MVPHLGQALFCSGTEVRTVESLSSTAGPFSQAASPHPMLAFVDLTSEKEKHALAEQHALIFFIFWRDVLVVSDDTCLLFQWNLNALIVVILDKHRDQISVM